MLTFIFCCLAINEIAHAPANPTAEYVELLHTGSARLSLAGATLYDERGVPRLISARPLHVEPGEYVVLVRDGQAFSQDFPGVPFLQVAGWPSLNNGGDRVAIALDGIELDAVAYDADWGTGPASLERLDPAGPSSHRVNWRPSYSLGTPGQRNSRYAPDTTPPRLTYAEVFHPDSALVVFSEPVLRAEPSAFGGGSIQWESDSIAVLAGTPFLAGWNAQDSATLEATQIRDLFGNAALTTSVDVARTPSPGELVISERLVRPLADPFDGRPDQVRFLELWNRSGALLSVRGQRLEGREADDGSHLAAAVPFAPRGIAPGATLVLTEDSEAARLAFGLGVALDVREVTRGVLRESRVTLAGRRGGLLDATAYESAWLDPVLGERGRALSRVADDGLSPLAWSADPEGVSPGLHAPWDEGHRPSPGDVLFSEVLFHAVSGQPEFIELLVREEAELNGLYLVIDRTPASPDSVRILYRPTLLVSGTLLTVVFPVSGVASADLLSHFRLAYPESGENLIPLAGSPTLRNDGVTMELRSGVGALLDRVSLTPNQHAPDLASVAGISLERVDPDGPSTEATNWVSARAASGGTPGHSFLGTGSPESATVPSGGGVLTVHPTVFDPREGPVTVAFAAREQASVHVGIHNRSGQRVRSLLLKSAGGSGRVYWDGRDDSGRLMRPGIFLVFVRDSEGKPHRNLVVLATR